MSIRRSTIQDWLGRHSRTNSLRALGVEGAGSVPATFTFNDQERTYLSDHARIRDVVERFDHRTIIVQDRLHDVTYRIRQNKLPIPARFALFGLTTACLSTAAAFGVMELGTVVTGSSIAAMGAATKTILCLITETVAFLPALVAVLYAITGPDIYTSLAFDGLVDDERRESLGRPRS